MKKLTAVFILIFLVTLAAIHLAIFTKSMEIKYQIEELKQTFNQLHSKNQSLAVEVSKNSAPGRIEKIAREKLNMFYPETIKYLKKVGPQ
jgi:cell division protein FtsL